MPIPIIKSAGTLINDPEVPLVYWQAHEVLDLSHLPDSLFFVFGAQDYCAWDVAEFQLDVIVDRHDLYAIVASLVYHNVLYLVELPIQSLL